MLFLLPESSHLPSGGNIYNSQLINDFGSAGLQVETTTSVEEVNRASTDDTLFIDSLYLYGDKLREYSRSGSTFLLCHLLQSFEPRRPLQKRKELAHYESKYLRLFSDVICPSPIVSQMMPTLSSLPQKLHLLPPTIESISTSASKYAGKLNLAMIGHLIEGKGIGEFLENIPSSLLSRINLSILGRRDLDTFYAQRVMNRIKELSAQGMGITHLDRDKDISSILNSADIVVSNSTFETFGMANAEVVASGKLLLARRGGYTAELLHESSAEVFDDVSTIFDRISYFLLNEDILQEKMQNAHASQNDFRDKLGLQRQICFKELLKSLAPAV